MRESGGWCDLLPDTPVHMSAQVAELLDACRADLLSVHDDFKGDHWVDTEQYVWPQVLWASVKWAVFVKPLEPAQRVVKYFPIKKCARACVA